MIETIKFSCGTVSYHSLNLPVEKYLADFPAERVLLILRESYTTDEGPPIPNNYKIVRKWQYKDIKAPEPLSLLLFDIYRGDLLR
jgi:hypothetical protein